MKSWGLVITVLGIGVKMGKGGSKMPTKGPASQMENVYGPWVQKHLKQWNQWGFSVNGSLQKQDLSGLKDKN